MASDDAHGFTCHRCRREFRAGDRMFVRPRRFLLRAGQTMMLLAAQSECYHERCLPPSLFHSGTEFPHQWGYAGFRLDGATLEAHRTCDLCGAKTTQSNWLDDLSGDNRDACPSTRDLAWQTIPDSSAPLPTQPA